MALVQSGVYTKATPFLVRVLIGCTMQAYLGTKGQLYPNVPNVERTS